MMQELVQQNRTQTNMMQSMQGEITRLTEKCRTMETSIKSVKLSAKDTKSQLNGIHQRVDTIDKKIDVIQSSTQMKLLGVDERLKYHEVLLQNQKWKYSAPRPSYQYWAGLNEDERGNAEEFLKQMKQYTEEMRYGITGDSCTIKVAAGHIPYDEVFLPHWKEFANALEQYHYHLEHAAKTEDSRLLLWSMELPDVVMKLLAQALKSTFFNRLALVGNDFGQKGVDFTLDYLGNNHRLVEFGLVSNPMKMKDIKRLCEIVKYHPSIELLSLNHCIGADINGFEMLKQIITNCMNTLNGLTLHDNGISTGGDTFIADFIRSNNTLGSIRLSNNNLDDNDATNIAEALKDNTKLRTLNIGDNSVTNAGWEALGKAVFDKTSLNSAADSNHTCWIDFPEDDNEFDEVRKINGISTGGYIYRKIQHFDPTYVRQRKIYSILSARNRSSSNVEHFDDDMPVELLPDMLASIQKYAGYHVPNSEGIPPQDPADVKPLSIMFEILQWDKSLALFEALSS